MATTGDGGVSWQVRSAATPAVGLPAPLPGYQITIRPLIVGLAFPDATHGWAAAGQSILATSDGGATWTSQDAGAALSGLSFSDATHGWAVGASGLVGAHSVILHTADGGQSWQTQYTGPYRAGGFPGFAAVDSVDADHAWVTGWVVCGSVIWATVDGGRHWRLQRPGARSAP